MLPDVGIDSFVEVIVCHLNHVEVFATSSHSIVFMSLAKHMKFLIDRMRYVFTIIYSSNRFLIQQRRIIKK